jgi:hypothetical protein
MRPTLENFFALALLLGAGAWFLQGAFAGKPEFEPGLAFVVALAAIFAKEPIKKHFGWGQDASQHDRDLFAQFQALVPADPAIKFVKLQDFGDSFVKARVDPLIDFVETWNSVNTEFLEPRIQEHKQTFYRAADEFVTELARRTTPTRNHGFISVYPDSMREVVQGRPQSVLDDAKILNELAKRVVSKYELFVRYGKSRLAQ